MMTIQREVSVHYKDGYAFVAFGDEEIQIARGDSKSSNYLCPVKLVSAALGS